MVQPNSTHNAEVGGSSPPVTTTFQVLSCIVPERIKVSAGDLRDPSRLLTVSYDHLRSHRHFGGVHAAAETSKNKQFARRLPNSSYRPATTRSLQSRYSRRRCKSEFVGGGFIKERMSEVLSASFTCCACWLRPEACSACSCLRSAI
jgi:hypothetical protein